MSNWLTIALTLFLCTDADLPRIEHLRPSSNALQTFPPGEEIPVLPNIVDTPDESQSQTKPQSKTQTTRKSATLQEESKLALIRYVSGEFAKALKPLPAGKEGFLLYAGKPVNEEKLDRTVASHGAAVNTGDNVQVTRLEFREHSIVVDVNGGGRGRRRWRDHIQIGIGGSRYPVGQTTTSSQQDQGPPGIQPGTGSTIFLEFTKAVPDLTPDDLKQLLAPILDFSKERSAAVQWFDTLPVEMKQAITERRAVVGMDREEVVAAIGKPDRKVRERDSDGNEIEDWIYGTPPNKTVFVRFSGDRVTVIKQYPR